MSKSRKAILTLSWHSVAYGAGTIGSQLVSYLVLPVLTRSLTQEEYGAIPLLLALFSFLNMLTNAGLPSATYHYYNASEEPRQKKLTLGGSQFLFFVFAAVPAALMFIFAGDFSVLLLGSEDFALSVRLVAIYLVTDTMNAFGSIILRIQVRPLVSSLHTIFMITLKMGLAIFFVVTFEMGANGYWMGYLLGSAIAMIVMIWLVRDAISFQFQKKDLKDLVAFGLPLIPSAASMVILRLSDRYIISALAGLEQVAIYDIGYKVGTLLTLLITPFRNAWSPFAFSMANKPEAPKIFRDVLSYIVAVSTLFALGLTAFRKEIIFILAPSSYAEAAEIVGWVAFSHIFIAAHTIISSSMVTQKKGGHLSWIATLAGAVNIALNFLLIPVIGIIGAAIATSAGYAILSLLSYIVGKRWFDMQINWLRLGRIALAALPVVVGVRLIESADLAIWLAVTLKLVCLLAFPLLLLAVRFITRDQIQEMVAVIKSIMSRRKDKQAAEGDAV